MNMIVKLLIYMRMNKIDIYKSNLKSSYYVSEKLKEAIEKVNFKGIKFIPIEELKYPLK